MLFSFFIQKLYVVLSYDSIGLFCCLYHTKSKTQRKVRRCKIQIFLRTAVRVPCGQDGKDDLGGELPVFGIALEAARHLRHDLRAGAQADLVGFNAPRAGVHAVGQADVQRPILQQRRDGHGPGGIGIFADVVEQIVEHALEVGHVGLDLHVLLRQEQLDRKALLLQLRAALAQELAEQDRRVVALQLQRQLLAAEQQGVAEQLVGQPLELLGLAVGGVQIALQLLLRPVLPGLCQIQIPQQSGCRATWR